ncbi:hypothetical protein QR680_009682 [Steinernema hermaphroditum]|uniref:Replication termination factor 2 n=1 Tax=Steinernema hermaphroditum TaxID=289476 RepID=A0AA39IL95_9BILA|nr:hypothetical protein QR680_009682 [Steinernema hermaphroditum]
MGADGGTIPKRCELVRNKKKAEKVDKNVTNASKWRMCQLSQSPLQKHIIACRFGRLYNKEAILEGLINKTLNQNELTRHIKSRKDFKELKLTKNPAFKGDGVNSDESYVDHNETPYVCPVTAVGMNGTNVFTVNWECGCVVSEKAIKEVPSETCHGCGGPFSKGKIVVLNPPEELLKKYEADLLAERAAKKAAKAAKANGAVEEVDCAGPSTKNGEASSSKQEKPTEKTAPKRKADPTVKSVQDDPTASKVFKSLFTSSDAAKKRPQAHWVTYNPLFN